MYETVEVGWGSWTPSQGPVLACLLLVEQKIPLDLVSVPQKDELCGPDPSLSDELTSILDELTQLSKSEHCKVALRARQVGWPAVVPTAPRAHGVPSSTMPSPPHAQPLCCRTGPWRLPCEDGSPQPLDPLSSPRRS